MAEERNLEETNPPACSKSKCCCGKFLCLKGLATIYKVLSILTLIVMVGMIGWAWYEVIASGAKITEGLLLTLQIIIYYGFTALVLITISRILKTLRKIKHAVEHR
ncbi:MAG: hypothetical protein II972_01215 [Elusimicrobiaceae bacterium]|nr:hypothetical protein [Elusimicrobiaceae bacterium]MBQ6223924.1 hypothetical protein [Campylobacter sp.]